MTSYINQIINICQLFSRAFVNERKHSFYNIEKRMGTSLLVQIKRINKIFYEEKVSEIRTRPDKQDISKQKQKRRQQE